MKKIAALNIDVDPLICYYAIHGLEYSSTGVDPIYAFGVGRFLDLLDKNGIKGTFFITANGFNDGNLDILRSIVERGHEIADHSFSHDYQLTRMTKEGIRREIEQNSAFLKEKAGAECKGFRSPGYNSSPDLISVIKSNGYIYDSSLFPSPAYYLAKALLIAQKRLFGHISKSFIYSFGDAFGRYTPEFIDKNVKDVQKTGNFVELPMTTLLYPVGIPLIGTSMIAFPGWLLNFLLKLSKGREFINIEAHGIDMCDAGDSPDFAPLKSRQPDLSFGLDRKIERFQQVIDFYKNEGFTFKRLDEIAAEKIAQLKKE